MSTAHDDHQDVSADIAAIVVRAGQLGFSTTRVATALGISQRALAATELGPSAGHHLLRDHSGGAPPR